MFDDAFAPARTTGVAGGGQGGGGGRTVKKPGVDCVGLQPFAKVATMNHCHAPGSRSRSRWSCAVEATSAGGAPFAPAKSWYCDAPGTALQWELTRPSTAVLSPGSVRTALFVGQFGSRASVNDACADSTPGQAS